MDILRLVRRNLLRDKRRTLLTVASLSIIVILLAVLLTVYNTLQATVNDPRAQRIFGIRDRTAVYPGGLPEGYIGQLRQIGGVADVMPWDFVFARVEPTYPLTGMAVGPESLPQLMPPLVKGVPEDQYRAFAANRTGALVGPELMKRYHWKVGDTFTLIGGSVDNDFALRIEGVLAFDMVADNFLMHYDYYRSLACECSATLANLVFFRVDESADLAAVRAAVEEHFATQPEEIELVNIVDFVSEIAASAGDAARLALGMIAVTAAAALLVVANTLAMAARERARDIAVLRALGFRARQVLQLVLGEAGLLALVGCTLGTLVAYVAFHATGFTMRMGAHSHFTVGGLTALESLLASLAMGLLAGLGPALYSLRVDVVETLRKVV
jgi:putative ABC transport system permease protein